MKKKGIKKLLAMVFAFVLMFSCMSTAWATDASGTGSIKITNVQSSGHKFYAYQIFSGTTYEDTSTDQSKYILSDIEWGSGINKSDLSGLYKALEKITLDNDTTFPFASVASASDVAAVLDGYPDDSTMLMKFAEVISGYLSTTKSSVATTTGNSAPYTYTITGLADGYYFVKDEEESSQVDDAYTRYIVQVVGQASISTKAVYPTVAKTILESDGTETNATSASAEDTVTFKLEGAIPSDLTSYSSYTFKFVDTLSANLTYSSSNDNMYVVATKYTEADVTSGFDNSTTYYTYNDSTGMYEEVDTTVTTTPADKTIYYVVSSTQELYDSTNTTNTSTYTYTKEYDTTDKTLKISINNIITNDLAGYTITVTYDAALASGVVAGTTETNTVYIEYSDNPNDSSSTSETTKHKVYVYTFDLNVLKQDGDGNGLAGAKFTLYKEVSVTDSTFSNGTYYAYADGSMTKASTYESGITYYEVVDSDVEAEEATSGSRTYQATFNDLGEGTYVLVETTTPNGYNTAEAIQFTVTATYDNEGSSVTNLTTDNNSVEVDMDSTATLSTTVVNNAGSTLPETGGRGTTMFYIIGGILVFGAAVLLITRRRMGREE